MQDIHEESLNESVKSEQSPRVVLWEIDLTVQGGERYFFCNELNEKGEAVTWQGRQYQAYPIDGSGFEMNGKGSSARPSLTVSNLFGLVTGMAEDLQSLVGATVVRRRVYARFLDAVNFVAGNPEADPEQELSDRWVVEQMSELTAMTASFVLATPTETDGALFPGRIMLANTCMWDYRGDECGYNGPAVADEFDNPTTDIRKDRCSKCMRGCEMRGMVAILAVSFPLINFRSKSRFMTQTESAILAHARRCAPAESCGFVVRTPEGERYIPCVNISAEPEAYFRIAPEDWLRAEMQGEIVALVHSHPGGLPWLSEADRRLQIKSALSWWLVCRGDIHKFRCVPHLTGRLFEHGVTDCYTLFRDAYHLAGIDMPDFEREDDWWRNGQNLYLDNMEATGFYRISLPSAQPGDILLCCFGASVANHAAIYCGNGELLHHLPEQLSKRERYSEKWQRRTHSAWRHRHWHVSAFTGIYNDLAAASACM